MSSDKQNVECTTLKMDKKYYRQEGKSGVTW